MVKRKTLITSAIIVGLVAFSLAIANLILPQADVPRVPLKPSAPKEGTGITVGSIAPDFSLVDIYGNRLTLSGLKGKPVILWFMAVWCPSCIIVGPIIRDVVNHVNVTVVVIDIWTEEVLDKLGLLGHTGIPPVEDADDLRRFISEFGDDRWILAMDRIGLTLVYDLKYVDTLFLIDPAGKIRLRSDGPISPSVLTQALNELSKDLPAT